MTFMYAAPFDGPMFTPPGIPFGPFKPEPEQQQQQQQQQTIPHQNSAPTTVVVTRKQVLDELAKAPRHAIALFLAIVGVEGYDGKAMSVEEAWEIARGTRHVGVAP